MKQTVFNISRGSLSDGDGIRTVVYLKGCPLSCKWCHNPESWKASPQVLFYPTKCIGCGRCLDVCEFGCHKNQNGEHVFDRTSCTGCGKCADACPSGALAICGEQKTAEEIYSEIKKDIHYFEKSSGGVTFSGGEALIYPDFLVEVLQLCKNDGIHTAIETSFFAPFENIEKIVNLIDLFIVDIKLYDSEKHKKFTGVKNELILENLTKLSGLHDNVWIRIPLIPDVNDDDQNLADTAKFIKSLGSCVKKVELLKYNNLAPSKYRALGIYDGIFEAKPQTNEEMASKVTILSDILGNIVSHE